MSIFSKCFKSSSETIERELENLYTETNHSLTGESLEKSRKDVKNAIKMCKERGKKERTDLWLNLFICDVILTLILKAPLNLVTFFSYDETHKNI